MSVACNSYVYAIRKKLQWLVVVVIFIMEIVSFNVKLKR